VRGVGSEAKWKQHSSELYSVFLLSEPRYLNQCRIYWTSGVSLLIRADSFHF
jgi:hypothetical protein